MKQLKAIIPKIFNRGSGSKESKIFIVEREFELPAEALEPLGSREITRVTHTQDEVIAKLSPGVDIVEQKETGVVLMERRFRIKLDKLTNKFKRLDSGE